MKNKQAALVTLPAEKRGSPSCPAHTLPLLLWGVHYRECCYQAKGKVPRALCGAALYNRKMKWIIFILRSSLLTQAFTYLSEVTVPHLAQCPGSGVGGITNNKYLTGSRGDCFTRAPSPEKTTEAHRCWQLHRLPEGCAADTKCQCMCMRCLSRGVWLPV